MSQRSTLLLFLVAALIICVFDAYSALHGHGGHVTVAWIMAAIMAVIAVLVLRKLLALTGDSEPRV
ncbi:MAG: hypothetical protein M3M96_09705 [Candidatus Eremiobacteraeota bacterium]|nr:hypothetical protein [Candidatus Eremiobacteraeota bacterium]